MPSSPIQTYAENVRLLIVDRLRLQAPTLQQALKKAGRLLPKWAHRDGAYLVEALALSSHPKLHLQIDDTKAKKAHDALVAYLETIDPKDQRKTAVLRLLGVISFNMIVVFTGLIIVLMWRGYL